MSAMQSFPVDDNGHPIGCEEDTLAARWAAMHKAAEAIAKMLGSEMPGGDRGVSLYPVGLRADDAARLETATADLCAMMQQGLFAILRARENGAEAKVAAKTLLRRFGIERRALLAEREEETDLAA